MDLRCTAQSTEPLLIAQSTKPLLMFLEFCVTNQSLSSQRGQIETALCKQPMVLWKHFPRCVVILDLF